MNQKNQTRTITAAVALTAMLVLSASCMSGAPTSSADRGQVKEALEAYVRAGDRRDLTAMETIMHPRFRAVVQFKGSGKVSFMSKKTMLGLMKAGKIGGTPRDISFHQVETRGDVASARATLRSAALRFHSRYSFVREDGRWRVVQDSVLAEKL